jgi:hypothetical protein
MGNKCGTCYREWEGKDHLKSSVHIDALTQTCKSRTDPNGNRGRWIG